MFRTASLAALCVLLLSACQTAKDAAMCPASDVLANTDTLTSFKKGQENDPSAERFTVKLTAVKLSCSFDKDEGTTDSDIELTFVATRPPSGGEGNFTVPYYIASLIDGTTVLDKHIYAAAFSFPPGQAATSFTAEVPSFVVKFANGKKPYQYGLLAGIQLSREEYDYAKAHGPLGP